MSTLDGIQDATNPSPSSGSHTTCALLVPIHLDALVLDHDAWAIAAAADFSRLPYRSEGQVNGDIPYVGDAITSAPFTDRSTRLQRGVHLHWAMPDGLTQAVNTPRGLVSPALPDRWLVTRTRKDDPSDQQQWIVESDYLYPAHGPDPAINPVPEGTITFPVPPHPSGHDAQPFRYLGRSWPVDHGRPYSADGEWLNSLVAEPADDRSSEWDRALDAGLTALGYGDPSFAALYPSCRSVFGFHDPDVTSADFAEFVYDVVGWYADPERRDPLHSQVFADSRVAVADRVEDEHLRSGHIPPPLATVDEHDQALTHRFGWLPHRLRADRELLPQRMFCHGAVTPTVQPDFDLDDAVEDATVSIGSTAGEALSALMAHQTPGDKRLIEEQLEALDLSQHLQHRIVDVGPAFEEVRHNKGFSSSPPGSLFTVRIEREARGDLADRAADVAMTPAPTNHPLPAYVAHQLHALNLAQEAFLDAEGDIESLRTQVHHDWTLYMQAMRPPDGTAEGYPDPLEVAAFIEREGLRPLRAMIGETGPPVTITQELSGFGRDAAIASVSVPVHVDPTSLSGQVATAATDLLRSLTTTNELIAALARLDRLAAAASRRQGAHTDLDADSPTATGFHVEPLNVGKPIRSVSFWTSDDEDDPFDGLVTVGEDGLGRVWSLADDSLAYAIHSAANWDNNIWDYNFDVRGGTFFMGGDRHYEMAFATVGRGGSVVLWDFDKGLPWVVAYACNAVGECGITFEPTGRRFVTFGKRVQIWDVPREDDVWLFRTEWRLYEIAELRDHDTIEAGFNAAGEVVTVSAEGIVETWRVPNGDDYYECPDHETDGFSGLRLHTFSTGAGRPTLAELDHTAQRVLTAYLDGTVHVCDVTDGSTIVEFANHAPVSSAAFSKDGGSIVTGGTDGRLRGWAADTGSSVLNLDAHAPAAVTAVTLSDDAGRIGTGGADGTAKVWNSTTTRVDHTFDSHVFLPAAVARDGRIAAASNVGLALISAPGEQPTLLRREKYDGALCRLSFDRDEKRVLLTGERGHASAHDTATGLAVKTFATGHDEEILAGCFDPTGALVFLGHPKEGLVVAYDVESGEEVRRGTVDMARGVEAVACVDVGSGAYEVAVTGPDGRFALLAADLQSARTLESLPVASHEGLAFAASPDGARLACGTDHGVCVWNTLTAELLWCKDVGINEDYFFTIAFSPDGSHVAAGSDEGLVAVWETKSGSEVFRLPQFSEAVYSIAFSPSGRRLIIGTESSVETWSIASAESALRTVLRRHGETVADDAEIGALRDQLDARIGTFADAEAHVSLLDDLLAVLSFLDDEDEPPAEPTMRFALRQVTAPRFHRPRDPVVMLSAPGLEPTDRHGEDGRGRDDGKLDCHVRSVEGLDHLDDPLVDTYLPALNVIRAVADDLHHDVVGARSWASQPWHPLALEWEVEVAPTNDGGSRQSRDGAYDPDFVTRNYLLHEAATDLAPTYDADPSATTSDTGLYSGACVLTDYASPLLATKIDEYVAAAMDHDVDPGVRATTDETLSQVRSRLAALPPTMSQALDGLHDALLQRHRGLQLPVVDPIGLPDLAPFTAAVRRAAAGRHSSSPMRDHDFMPIRSGTVKLRRLRLIDTFGLARDIEDATLTDIVVSETLRRGRNDSTIDLAPRLNQPARLHFRWLSATSHHGSDALPATAHPAYNPVCGWLAPNHLDSSLLVFDSDGSALGSIVGPLASGGGPRWQSAPGRDIAQWELRRNDLSRMNPHLRAVVDCILHGAGEAEGHFFREFLTTLDNALEAIAPETISHHDSLALLTTRPVAVVRASVDLQLRGTPAPNQSMSTFLRDLHAPPATPRTTDGFGDVRFPIRIGEDRRLGDGLVGYFVESPDGFVDDVFHAPQASTRQSVRTVTDERQVSRISDLLDERLLPDALLSDIEQPSGGVVSIEETGRRWRIDTSWGVYQVVRDKKRLEVLRLTDSLSRHIRVHWKEPVNLTQSLNDAPHHLTMLIDPHCPVHAVSGIVPTEALELPPEHFAGSLRRLEVGFLAAPVLTDREHVRMPLSTEAGRTWSWLSRTGERWSERSTIDRVEAQPMFTKQRIVEGWLELSAQEDA